MTPDEVRAAAAELHHLHQRFAPLFGTPAAQGHALTYLRGLLLHEGRKNTEAMVLSTTDQSVRPLQQFLADSRWDYRPAQHLVTIQRLLGHRDLQTTARYVHVTAPRLAGLPGLLEGLPPVPATAPPAAPPAVAPAGVAPVLPAAAAAPVPPF